MTTKKKVEAVTLAEGLRETSHRMIREAMVAAGGNATHAAAALGISHRHLCRLLEAPELADVERGKPGNPAYRTRV